MARRFFADGKTVVKRKTPLVESWSGRAFLASLVLMVSLGLFGLGSLLANSYGAAQVAGNARQLHWTNATLGRTGIARAAVAQAVFFSFEEVSDDEAKEVAMGEARQNLSDVSEILETPDSLLGREINVALGDFVESGRETLDLAENGAASAAESKRLSEFEPIFEALQADLNGQQGELAALIADSDRTGGLVSRITFVAIAFFIPAVTMIVFWLLMRRRVRERETEMRARLEAERDLNKAKDEFIAGLSHELRTPLTTIVGFTEILSADPSLSAEARDHLDLISASSADLRRMVNDLLTAARLDADALTISPQETDLAEQARLATSSYGGTEKSLSIRVPRLRVYADPLLVRQVIHNLVSNALRHGGDTVTITGSEKAGVVVLVVADDGPGVPPDLEERLFKRFFHKGRQALVAGSVGLGLAISQELSRRMGGALIYRRVEGWTTFTLRLPKVPDYKVEPTQPALAGIGQPK